MRKVICQRPLIILKRILRLVFRIFDQTHGQHEQRHRSKQKPEHKNQSAPDRQTGDIRFRICTNPRNAVLRSDQAHNRNRLLFPVVTAVFHLALISFERLTDLLRAFAGNRIIFIRITADNAGHTAARKNVIFIVVHFVQHITFLRKINRNREGLLIF